MEKKRKPLVSVIITTFHNVEYLSRAIESVLHQTYPEIELIVVDDNPPDSEARRGTEKVMERYPQVLYLKHPENRNGAAARNTGIRSAGGEYIAFLDNDDIYFGDHIRKCVDVLEENPEYGSVLCGVLKVRSGVCWEIVLPPSGDMVKALFMSETALGTGSNLFARTHLIRKINGFDESFLRHQDIEFGVRLFSQSKVFRIREIQIVKAMDGFSNAPDFERFLKTKRHFMDKFGGELKKMTEEEQKRCYAGQCSALLYTACKSGKEKHIAWVISELKQYRNLNKKEKLLVCLSRFHLFDSYEKIKWFIKKRNSGKMYRKVSYDLADYDKKLFAEMLKG